jgi:hypothetical protein
MRLISWTLRSGSEQYSYAVKTDSPVLNFHLCKTSLNLAVIANIRLFIANLLSEVQISAATKN